MVAVERRSRQLADGLAERFSAVEVLHFDQCVPNWTHRSLNSAGLPSPEFSRLTAMP